MPKHPREPLDWKQNLDSVQPYHPKEVCSPPQVVRTRPFFASSNNDRICPPGFPTYAEYQSAESAYLFSLSHTKRRKALITQEMFDDIWDALHYPYVRIVDAQFRFWVRKMFTLTNSGHDGTFPVVLHQDKPVAVREQLYEVLCYCHALALHGGRDKTCAAVRRHWSWVPKELIARFVMACPTCTYKKSKQPRRASNAKWHKLPSGKPILHDVDARSILIADAGSSAGSRQSAPLSALTQSGGDAGREATGGSRKGPILHSWFPPEVIVEGVSDEPHHSRPILTHPPFRLPMPPMPHRSCTHTHSVLPPFTLAPLQPLATERNETLPPLMQVLHGGGRIIRSATVSPNPSIGSLNVTQPAQLPPSLHSLRLSAPVESPREAHIDPALLSFGNASGPSGQGKNYQHEAANSPWRVSTPLTNATNATNAPYGPNRTTSLSRAMIQYPNSSGTNSPRLTSGQKENAVSPLEMTRDGQVLAPSMSSPPSTLPAFFSTGEYSNLARW
jgi:hypothetical protein